MAGCTVRQYTFNRNGARTNLATHNGQAGQACPATTGTPTVTRAWTVDAADRITAATRTTTGAGGTTVTGSYVFDALGRVTTLPGIDVPGGVNAGTTGGNATLAYRADDSAWKITIPSTTGTTTGTLTQTYTYDSMGRRVTAASVDTSKTAGAQDVANLVRHYTDTSDNPTWTAATDPDPANPALTRTTTTRYLAGLGGGLAITATKTTDMAGATAGLQVMLANHHGDITATTQLIISGGGQWSTGTGINTWHDTDEYGNPSTSSAKAPTSAGYGWHGTAERSTNTPAGLTVMGARLYNPIAGLFTSTDPVHGGNDTSYTYPSDPLNSSDLDGRANKKKSWWTRIIDSPRLGWLFKQRDLGGHIKMRGGLPALHWRTSPRSAPHRIEFERGGKGWHYNRPKGGHYSVKEGLRSYARFMKPGLYRSAINGAMKARSWSSRVVSGISRGGGALWMPIAPPPGGWCPACNRDTSHTVA